MKKSQFINLVKELLEELQNSNSKTNERELTKREKTGLKRLEKDIPKTPFKRQYGKKEGEKIYYATLTKQAKKRF